VDLGAAVVADEQPLEVVEPGEGALDHPTGAAESGPVLGPAAGDGGSDASLADEAAVLVVVVAAIGDDHVGAKARPADLATYRRDALEKRDQLRNVVAIAARERPRERDPGGVYQEMMLGAGSGSINRARARLGAPFLACT
jgi:hypothetical protein